jgi:hypothetical protein
VLVMQAEIAEESALTCGFIITREIEAPERFQVGSTEAACIAALLSCLTCMHAMPGHTAAGWFAEE